jgi:3-hydroxyisobutyrate dehydrogenase-like beta-hydroxyacid dehydrogenase
MNNLLHLKHQDRIGWIGLGEMGYNMASNLQRYLASLHLKLTVWNRTPAKSQRIHRHGAHVAKSLEELVATSNIVSVSSILFIFTGARQTSLVEFETRDL